jgi:hypothetical protein
MSCLRSTASTASAVVSQIRRAEMFREQRPQTFGDGEVRDNGITQLRAG